MATLSSDERRRLGTVRTELLSKLLALKDRAAAYGLAPVVAEDGGFRSHATQTALYADSLAQGGGSLAYPVATPGSSRHEYGAAFDLSLPGGDDAGYALLATLASGVGLTAGYYFSNPDPYHFQLDETLQESKDAWNTLTPSMATAKSLAIPVAIAATVAAMIWAMKR